MRFHAEIIELVTIWHGTPPRDRAIQASIYGRRFLFIFAIFPEIQLTRRGAPMTSAVAYLSVTIFNLTSAQSSYLFLDNTTGACQLELNF